MDCNGKCALKKQLKSASKEKEQSKEDFDFAQQLQLSFFVSSDLSRFEFHLFKEGNTSLAFHKEGLVKYPILEIDHPPC